MAPTQRFERQYPQMLRDLERVLLARRRLGAGVGNGETVVGIALSGGGIRSATFVLGFLQGLAQSAGGKPGLVRRVDLMSTVSGGGYLGAFLGALFTRRPGPEAVERELQDCSSRSVDWLRENGRYLAPNSSGDSLLAGAIVLRNWVAVTMVMGVAVLGLMTAAHLARIAARNALEWYGSAGWAGEALAGVGRATTPTFALYWSAYLFPAAAVFMFAAVPFGWAYWLGRLSKNRDHLWVWLTTGIVWVTSVVGAFSSADSAYTQAFALLGVVASETVLVGLAFTVTARASDGDPFGDRVYRNRLSRVMTAALVVAAGIAGLGIVDTLGQTTYVLAWGGAFQHKTIAAIAAGTFGLVAGSQSLLKFLDTGERGNRRIRLPFAVLAGAAALIAALLLLTSLSAVSHGIARDWRAPVESGRCEPAIDVSLSLQNYITVTQAAPCSPPVLPRLRGTATLEATLVLALISFFFGRSLPFVNLSSLSQFYSARLSRTYIGASNPNRQSGAGVNVTTEMSGDDISMAAYAPYDHGGPLHLINVTLNETVQGRSQVEDRDRKGLALAVGPSGVSVGVTQHAVWAGVSGSRTQLVEVPTSPAADPADTAYRVWKGSPIVPRPLALSQWTAISGAAVAPGMGARTSLAVSLLLTIANVRLGYWWNSGVDSRAQLGTTPKPSLKFQHLIASIFPVQGALLQELVAQFHGPHQELWFLSDGGHFENTACYELLRRRVPLVIICDDGADPGYEFEDLANLVRKARIDFGAEIQLIEPTGLQSPLVGSVDDLKPTRPRDNGSADAAGRLALCRRHVICARVLYHDEGHIAIGDERPGPAQSLLVIVKPSVTGDEPLDVLQYAAAHPTFPQETTSDQFFDEAQWESYRKLGEHIGAHVNLLDLDKLLADETRSA